MSKYKNNDKYLYWISALSALSLTVSHSLPHLPRMPSNTGLVSGPSMEAAQTLILLLYVLASSVHSRQS